MLFTPRSEAQTQRASQGQGLSTVCENSEDEIQQLVAQRQDFETADEIATAFWCARRVSAHNDKRLWKAVDFRQGTTIPGSESKKCSLTKNDIPARIALREEARWQGKGDRLREKLRVFGS